MTEAIDPRTGARFALERIDVDADVVTVSGRWAEVRELRFERPELVAGDERVPALPMHRPWTPRGAQRWTVRFPWTEGVDALREAQLDVGDGIVVALVPAGARVEREGGDGRAADGRDPDGGPAVRAPFPQARPARAVPPAEDHAQAELRRRVRTLERELGELRGERDEAVASVAELRAQLHAARQEIQRRPAPRPAEPLDWADADEEALGVRTKPRTEMPASELERVPAPLMESRLTESDLVAIRAFGALAAILGFVLLIVLLGVLL